MSKKTGFIKETWKYSTISERIAIIGCLVSIMFFILAGTYTSIIGAFVMILTLMFNIDNTWKREETNEMRRHINMITDVVIVLMKEREDKNNDIR